MKYWNKVGGGGTKQQTIKATWFLLLSQKQPFSNFVAVGVQLQNEGGYA